MNNPVIHYSSILVKKRMEIGYHVVYSYDCTRLNDAQTKSKNVVILLSVYEYVILRVTDSNV